MREAMGSTFLFKLMIIFIFFLSAFLAIIINYSQAFRMKNQIINILEQSEGYTESARDDIVSVVGDYGYFRNRQCPNGTGVTNSSGQRIRGVCIQKLPSDTSTSNRYYRVSTFVGFNLPVIGNLFTFEVVGETKQITNFTAEEELSLQ